MRLFRINRNNDLCKTILVNRDSKFDDNDDNCDDDNYIDDYDDDDDGEVL